MALAPQKADEHQSRRKHSTVCVHSARSCSLSNRSGNTTLLTRLMLEVEGDRPRTGVMEFGCAWNKAWVWDRFGLVLAVVGGWKRAEVGTRGGTGARVLLCFVWSCVYEWEWPVVMMKMYLDRGQLEALFQ